MEEEFNSVEQLYARLEPALISKQQEFNMLGFKRITKDDIWDYLREHVWLRTVGLDLFEMVESIFIVKPEEIENYLEGKVQ